MTGDARSTVAPTAPIATPPADPPRPFVSPVGLVSRSAPPLRLPGQHFTAALVFWVLGATGIVWVAPDIAQGLFPLPRVVAVTHLFTLGWITTTILGALCQFLPVALQVPIRSERLAHVSFALHVPGVALFLGGMLASSHSTLLAGAALFGTGLLLFCGNMAVSLRRASDRNLTWWTLVGATVSLFCTVLLGASLAGNLRWDYLGANRFLALGVHLHIAIGGWVMLVIVGVAHRLLPMFLLSHGASERPGKIAAGLLAAGIGLLLVFHHGLTPILLGLIALTLGGGVVAFLVQAALFFRHRKKPVLDPGLRLAAVALGHLGLALAVAPFFLTQGLAAPRIATAYVLLLVGAPALFVAGIYYKILPFLIWFHRFGPLVGKQPVPRVVDLYDVRTGNAAVVLLATGLMGLVIATVTGAVGVARPLAAIFAAGATVVAAQMFTISRRRPQ